MAMNIVFLGSGGGGNLKFIHQYFKGYPDVEICQLLVDRTCSALDYAKSASIASDKLTFKRDEQGIAQLMDALGRTAPDLIVTNVHKVLAEPVVDAFGGKLVNLHYSYLPAYQGLIGMAPVDKAMERNNSFICTSAHLVTKAVDDGNTISQGMFCRMGIGDVHQRTFECGALTLLGAVYSKLGKTDVPLLNHNDIFISPSSSLVDLDRCELIFSKLRTGL